MSTQLRLLLAAEGAASPTQDPLLVHRLDEGSGTSFARPLWNGKAQVEEIELDTPSGHIQGLTVRLYSTTTRQWSLYWANQKLGHM